MYYHPTSVQPTNDAGLRTLIHKNPKVIVKFTKKGCSICIRMWKHFLAFSHEPKYKDIQFLMIDSDENPVSSQSVRMSGNPFFVTYLNGKLQECMLVSDEKSLEDLLKRLLIA